MPIELLVVLLVVVVLVVGVVLYAVAQRRRWQQLQQRFGPEYERAVDEDSGHEQPAGRHADAHRSDGLRQR